MPGVAQVWLTDDELAALLTAAQLSTWTRRNDGFIASLKSARDKLQAAESAVACPAKEDNMIKTDGKPTIAWDPRLADILASDAPEPDVDEDANDDVDILIAP